MTILHYDGSFEGFLTAVFDIYANKWEDARIRPAESGDASLFGASLPVQTDAAKAARVWNALKTKTSEEASRHFYRNYLSELPLMEDHMLEYLRYVFASTQDVSQDFSHPAVLSVARISKMIGREKHRMEAFVRFRMIEGDLYYATIAPDYNVLPLLVKHFKSRYADQRWAIWDEKRGYGIFYDLEKVDMRYEPAPGAGISGEHLQPAYAQLWKTYFKSTNIVERRNMKLHVQHVPLRYWRYLSEKQP